MYVHVQDLSKNDYGGIRPLFIYIIPRRKWIDEKSFQYLTVVHAFRLIFSFLFKYPTCTQALKLYSDRIREDKTTEQLVTKLKFIP